MNYELIYIFASIAIILLCCAHKNALMSATHEGFFTKCFSCEAQEPHLAHGSKCFDCEKEMPLVRRVRRHAMHVRHPSKCFDCESKWQSTLTPPYVI